MKAFLESIDVFDKSTNDDFKFSTKAGYILSSLFSLFVTILVFLQISSVLKPELVRDLNLEAQSLEDQEMANVSIDILINMPCYFLHLDVVDSLGMDQLDIQTTAKFMRLTNDGKFIDIKNVSIQPICYPCFGVLPEGYCCNDCNQLLLLHLLQGRPADTSKFPQCKGRTRMGEMFKNEKCRIKGKVSLNKATGNFHIAPGFNIGNGLQHRHDVTEHIPNFDLSHKIQSMRVGRKIPLTYNPLNHYESKQRPGDIIVYKYTMLVTPVVYKSKGKVIGNGYDYTAMISKYYGSPTNTPGIYFHYSFTPYGVTVNANYLSFGQMITSTAGFLSGIFAILTLIDEIFFKEPAGEAKPSKENQENK